MATVAVPKIRREDVPEGRVLCEYCTAKCCRYFALPIETPEDARGLRIHPLVLATRSGHRLQGRRRLVPAGPHRCKHLQTDNRCGIYDTRPQICRDYSTENCEYDDDWTYDFYLETPEQVAEYMEAVLPRKRASSIRSPKPPLLPIIM